MRKRSTTLYANSLEEYTTLATESEVYINPFTVCQPVYLTQNNSTAYAQRSQSDSFSYEKFDPYNPAHQVSKKIMIIGSSSTGKYGLLNSTFCLNKSKPQPPMNQALDLIIKDEQEHNMKIKYYLWIRNLDEKRFDDVVKVYYKNISLFVFVYSITDRGSFDTVVANIKEILKEVPRHKFVGVLVGSKNDQEDSRQVSISDGIKIKEEFSLSMFVETNQQEKTLKTKIQNVFYKTL